MVIIIVIVIAFIGLITYGIISQRKRREAMQALASKNGWTPLSNDESTLLQYLPQYIQLLGQQSYGFGGYTRTNSSYDMAYKAAIGSHTAVVFQYTYTEYHQSADPEQSEQSTTTCFSILNISLPVVEPTVLLLHHSFASKLINFGLHNGLQKINLEGNFNQYYDTYISPNGQVEALSVFTPDIIGASNGYGRFKDACLNTDERAIIDLLVLRINY